MLPQLCFFGSIAFSFIAWGIVNCSILRRSRLFGQFPGRNKLKTGSRLLV